MDFRERTVPNLEYFYKFMQLKPEIMHPAPDYNGFEVSSISRQDMRERRR